MITRAGAAHQSNPWMSVAIDPARSIRRDRSGADGLGLHPGIEFAIRHGIRMWRNR